MAIAPMPARKMSLNPSLRVAIRASYACDSPSATRTASASMMHQIDEKGNARNASMSEAEQGWLLLVAATAPPRSTGRQASTGVGRSSAARHMRRPASDVGAIQLAQQLRNARLARRAPAFRDAIFRRERTPRPCRAASSDSSLRHWTRVSMPSDMHAPPVWRQAVKAVVTTLVL